MIKRENEREQHIRKLEEEKGLRRRREEDGGGQEGGGGILLMTMTSPPHRWTPSGPRSSPWPMNDDQFVLPPSHPVPGDFGLSMLLRAPRDLYRSIHFVEISQDPNLRMKSKPTSGEIEIARILVAAHGRSPLTADARKPACAVPSGPHPPHMHCLTRSLRSRAATSLSHGRRACP